MKRLIASLLLFVSLAAGAEPFWLNFQEKGNELSLKFDQSEWEFVTHQNDWTMYLARGEVDEMKGFRLMYTMLVYDDPVKRDFTDKPVKKIFSFGFIACDASKLVLMNDFVTTEDHNVVHMTRHNFGDVVVDMDKKGTVAYQIHDLICKGKSV